MIKIKNFLKNKKIKFIEQNTKFHDVVVIRKNEKFIRITLCNYTNGTHNYHIYTIDEEFYIDTEEKVINFLGD